MKSPIDGLDDQRRQAHAGNPTEPCHDERANDRAGAENASSLL